MDGQMKSYVTNITGKEDYHFLTARLARTDILHSQNFSDSTQINDIISPYATSSAPIIKLRQET